jgi:Flp pilus assembly protein TadD
MLLKIADETYAGGDPATAASLYRQLHEMSPRDPVPLTRLAAIFMTMQDYRAAIEAYRAALALDANNADLHRGLASALLVMGDAQGAMVEVRAALAKRADDPRLYNLLGVAQDMVGRHDLAQQSYRHGSDMAPANVGLRNNYAMSLALSGDFGDAVGKLAEIAGPDAPPRYRLNLALAYGLAGDDAKAAATARGVLDESAVQNNLAYYALLRGMSEERRTAAIIGAELHGTAVSADAAIKPRSTAVAEVKPAPVPPPVAASTLPPLLPEAAATPLAAAAQPDPTAPARHVAALADRPAPAKPKGAKVAAAPDDAAASAPPPHDIAPLPAAAKEAALDPVPATPPAIAPDRPASAGAKPELASAPPISLIAPQTTAPAEPQAAPAALDPPPASPPADTAGPAAPPPDQSSEPSSTPPRPEASMAGPTAGHALDQAAVSAHSAAAPASAGSDFATQVSAWLDMNADALSAAPRAEPAIARQSYALHPTVESYTIQLGSFIYEESAHRIADAFAAKGIVVAISRSNDRDGREWYVARSGEFATMDDATGALLMIQSMGGAEPIVVRHRIAGEPTPAI